MTQKTSNFKTLSNRKWVIYSIYIHVFVVLCWKPSSIPLLLRTNSAGSSSFENTPSRVWNRLNPRSGLEETFICLQKHQSLIHPIQSTIKTKKKISRVIFEPGQIKDSFLAEKGFTFFLNIQSLFGDFHFDFISWLNTWVKIILFILLSLNPVEMKKL